jgi:tRNA A-37 threonylcarbamoyl transferase component Bud32
MNLLRPRANRAVERQVIADAAMRGQIAGILAQFMDVDEWSLRRLAFGGQAQLCMVRGGDRELVVKLFHAAAPELPQVVRTEHELLNKLARIVDGSRINGWTIRSPRSLYLSESPHALVMTMVPGVSLASRADDDCTCDHEVIDAVARALLRFWQDAGILYGDLTLHNILVDEASRSISFVDCGVPESTWHCKNVERRWYPASRDLAYLLFSVASAVRAYLGRSAVRRRQLAVVETMLDACINGLATSGQRASLAGEIHACARVHAAGIRGGASPAGLWRRLVRRQTIRCIDEVMDRM